ncbi:hypothetical protein PISMIDRAFT_677326 [Pisolithus microcarpus 441]|uniref:Uncharacterized protein n=1 Tax=Pisolithus microcarpus 441 TaxID=765257 RepID=A0A0C9Z7K0_9AGAM|nr:hypothetical protein PISMIDRAFT_677326 [Pisolithus microcarpus 441]
MGTNYLQIPSPLSHILFTIDANVIHELFSDCHKAASETSESCKARTMARQSLKAEKSPRTEAEREIDG